MLTRLIPALIIAAMPTIALAAPAEGGANPFAGKIFQAITAAVVFLILFYLLKTKAWGPILSGLQDREAKIKADLEAAEKASRDAKQTLEDYRKQVANAQAEARQIIDKGKSDAEKVAAQLRSEVESEVATMRQRAAADIDAAKTQALNEIYAKVADLSTEIAGRILRREINANDQQQIVRESLNELTRTSQN